MRPDPQKILQSSRHLRHPSVQLLGIVRAWHKDDVASLRFPLAFHLLVQECTKQPDSLIGEHPKQFLVVRWAVLDRV